MKNIIVALNMTEGAVLTLEKMPDRMEFEALAGLLEPESPDKGICIIKVHCDVCPDCQSLCEVCPYNNPCPDNMPGCPSKGMP